MSKPNAKSLASLRQRVRKYNRENFESEIAAYRENPDEGDTEEEGEKHCFATQDLAKECLRFEFQPEQQPLVNVETNMACGPDQTSIAWCSHCDV